MDMLEIINYSVRKEDDFVEILEAKFEQELEEIVQEKSISVQIKIEYFGKELDVLSLKDYDF